MRRRAHSLLLRSTREALPAAAIGTIGSSDTQSCFRHEAGQVAVAAESRHAEWCAQMKGRVGTNPCARAIKTGGQVEFRVGRQPRGKNDRATAASACPQMLAAPSSEVAEHRKYSAEHVTLSEAGADEAGCAPRATRRMRVRRETSSSSSVWLSHRRHMSSTIARRQQSGSRRRHCGGRCPWGR